MHTSTFGYLKPTNEQMALMGEARAAALYYFQVLHKVVPDGPDKTYLIRRLREVAMWANVAITRDLDGTPRTETPEQSPEYPADHPVKGDLGSVPL